MKYQYAPYAGNFFATMLRRDGTTHNLMWENSNGRTVLIVQCPYGKNPFERMEEICAAMEQAELEEETFMEVLPDIWVRKVTAIQKVRGKGCPLRGEASTYAVFCCEENEEEGICLIHAPQTEKKSRLDIPAEMTVSVTKGTVEVKKGLFGRKTEIQETGFYRIEFPASGTAGYNDGDLAYYINKLQIPITRQMIEEKVIYVKTDKKPDIRTENKGLSLKIR